MNNTITEKQPVKIIQTPVFDFDDLDEKAKENARNWWREGGLDFEWWDSTFEDAETIGLKIESFELERGRHAKGHFIEDAETVARLVIQNHGKQCETYKTAKAFQNDVRELKKLKAYDDRIGEISDDFEKSLLEDYSIMLQQEYDEMLSDEYVEDTIRSNEYTFTREGKRFG